MKGFYYYADFVLTLQYILFWNNAQMIENPKLRANTVPELHII